MHIWAQRCAEEILKERNVRAAKRSEAHTLLHKVRYDEQMVLDLSNKKGRQTDLKIKQRLIESR